MTNRGLLTNIQILRGIAAVMVVAGHSMVNLISYNSYEGYGTFLSSWGTIGVDIFFVISGFIITLTQHNSIDVYHFFVSRFFRIAPLYWALSLVLFVSLTLFPHVSRELAADPINLIQSLGFVSRVFGDGQPLLYVGWTLEFEMLFYLLFGVAMWITRNSPGFSRSILLSSVILLGICLNVFNSIMFEFVFGILIAEIYVHYKRHALISRFALILSMIGFTFGLSTRSIDIRWISWGIPAALLVLGSTFANQATSKHLVYLGESSFSIYLIQDFTLPAIFKITSEVGLQTHTAFMFTFSIFLTVLAGLLLHHFVEFPLLRYTKMKIR